MAAGLEHKPSMAASMAASVATQDTTYHSFYDVEMSNTPPPQKHKTPEPIVRNVSTRSNATARRHSHDRPTTAGQIKRQDSGYGSSSVSSPRPSTSYSRPAAPRRSSTTNAHTSSSKTSSGLSVLRNRTRPSTRRSSSKSYHLHNTNNTSSSLYLVRPGHTQQQSPNQSLAASPNTFFHFPSPNPMAALAPPPPPREPTPAPSIPPQAQHYWTSDRTRRLEYAAIDAASRGVKGWIKRNLIPDCFVAEDRHVAFDDDSGSVRRYRLELEEEAPDEKAKPCRRSASWHFWRSKEHQHSY
ncbi:unnamed protein product [Clonostachys rhizophaga]|uniref:Uncharacterized protein n=1 Tax=Clonostachys rhizophaga TaxID=160324 RepID=A0A9N9VTT0_9HYPO|nr:unnamed protein product [Clonostachys rhizophaga]